MKKRFLSTLLFLTLITIVKAQSYIGLLNENYAGVHGVINNPSSIADSRFKLDINLAGVSAFAANDFYSVKFMDAIKDGYEFDTQAIKSATDSNNMLVNLDVFGPSFMVNIDEKSAFAVSSRARLFLNANEINGAAAEQISLGFDGKNDVKLNEGDLALSSNSWIEIGGTYARVLKNEKSTFLKGGITLKYLKGIANGYTQGENISVDYDVDGKVVSGNAVPTVTTTGTITYGYSENIEGDNVEDVLGAKAGGFGIDLGATYEWRTDESLINNWENKYKLRVGLSVTDIGMINYKNGKQKSYDFNKQLTEDDFEKINDLDDIENYYSANSSGKIEKAVLPAAVHLNADYLAAKNVYVNFNTDLSLNGNKTNRSRIANRVSLTPRYEMKWVSAYMPISYMQFSGLNWGFGFRAGPLYAGSGSVLSLLTSKKTKGADVYAGLKIPFFQNKPKDKDGDGVLNKIDDCPEIAGPVENNGCPWPDTDGDEVFDKDDECKTEAGPKENKGCPWPDTDEDGVLDKDDKCPNIAGPVDNDGCLWPDTDKDGVLDKNDKCPNEVGTVANNGCPEIEEPKKITEEVQKSLNDYAKTILFNTGKSSIKEESNIVLYDIIRILKEYPVSRFTVEGHTDSVGSSILNQKLSESRANSIMNFLIQNGVDATRLMSVGYGENKPIANNKTKEGRKLNRRVEINLIK